MLITTLPRCWISDLISRREQANTADIALGGNVEILSLIVSLLALGATIFFAVRQQGLATRLGTIEEQRRAEELDARTRADLTAAYEATLDSTGRRAHFLVITNQGQARASDISFQVVAIGQGNPPAMHGVDKIESIDPGQHFNIPVAFFTGLADSVRVSLTWTDETGERSADVTVGTFI